MIVISHRGYIAGKNWKYANNPPHIQNLLNKNPDLFAEIDLQYLGGEIYLGHENETLYKIDNKFLIKNRHKLFIHCKNFAAVNYLKDIEKRFPRMKFNYFVHQNDDFCLTSRGFAWFFPGKEQEGADSILLDFTSNKRIIEGRFAGICCDFPSNYMTINL